ncbi:hypothetical protein IWX90DRAFT_514666 [Phyllosticta citrichinensis]|uniref:Uncharacterized protein n=1 Tax=Phyllosticta citrichinensis TaxID=1130410 RepID=A0ABR1XRE7_9PEZI
MACPLMSEPTGFMLNTIVGNPNSPPLDLGEDIRRAGALLMPDTKTHQCTENPADQQNLEEIIDLDKILPGFGVRDALEEAAKEGSEKKAKEDAKSASEGEWEDGADDADWEDLGPDMPPANQSPFMEMPRELREEIYAYLVVAGRTKQPPLHLLPHCPMQNQLNLATNMLRVNKQVHEEALGVLGRQNKFVVVERATRKLKSTPEDRQDGEFPNCLIWIGKNRKADPKNVDYFILLVEELETLCINLSRYVTGGVYRTNGLVGEVKIAPPPEAETAAVMRRREDALLNPLARLRAFGKVNIQGASPEKTIKTVMHMKRKEQTAIEAVRTGEHIAETAEAYNRVGYQFMSNSYLDWGTMLMGFYENDLLQGKMAQQESRKPLLVRFLLQKALNHLRLGDY